MFLYLDTCCLNRPFDDQRQTRIRLESEAVLALLTEVSADAHRIASSATLFYEISRIADQTRRDGVRHFLGYATSYQPMTPAVQSRATVLCGLGFKQFDALHLASAEELKVDAFLSTDDRLLLRASRLGGKLAVPVLNPLDFNNPMQ